MKRNVLFLIMLVFAISTFAMNSRIYPILNDTVKSTGDTVKSLDVSSYKKLQGANGANLFNPDCMKLLFWVDTAAALSNDSQEILLKVKYHFSGITQWSEYDSLPYILNSDSIRLPKIYDIPTRTGDAMKGMDSIAVSVKGGASNDKSTGNVVKCLFIFGEN